MGGKNSVAQFELIVSSFTTALVFRRPDLFSKDPKDNDHNLRLLFSYLDDFMCAAKSIQQSAMQYAFLMVIGGWLGLIFKPSKMEPPAQVQSFLGIIYNSIHKCIALKDKAPKKIIDIVTSFKNAAV